MALSSGVRHTGSSACLLNCCKCGNGDCELQSKPVALLLERVKCVVTEHAPEQSSRGDQLTAISAAICKLTGVQEGSHTIARHIQGTISTRPQALTQTTYTLRREKLARGEYCTTPDWENAKVDTAMRGHGGPLQTQNLEPR